MSLVPESKAIRRVNNTSAKKGAFSLRFRDLPMSPVNPVNARHSHAYASLLALPTSACTEWSPHAAFRYHNFPVVQTVPMSTSIMAKLSSAPPYNANYNSNDAADIAISHPLQRLCKIRCVFAFIIIGIAILAGVLTTTLLRMSVSDDSDNSRLLPPPPPHLPPRIPHYSPADRPYSPPPVVTFSIAGVPTLPYTVVDHARLIKAALYETTQQEVSFVDEDDIAVQRNVTVPGLYHVSIDCGSTEGSALLIKGAVTTPESITSMKQKTGFMEMNVDGVNIVEASTTHSPPAFPFPALPPLLPPKTRCYQHLTGEWRNFGTLSIRSSLTNALNTCRDDSMCMYVSGGAKNEPWVMTTANSTRVKKAGAETYTFNYTCGSSLPPSSPPLPPPRSPPRR